MKFEELVEKTVGIQVIDTDEAIGYLKKKYKVKAKQSKDYDDEIEIDFKDRKKVVDWMTSVGGWEEEDIADLYPELLEFTEDSVSIDLDELIESCAGRLPMGLQRAIFTNNGHKVLHRECDKCGFLMPKYKGRYPNYCPMCGDPVTAEDKEVVAEGIIGNEIGKSLANSTHKKIQKQNGGEILRAVGNGKSAMVAPPKVIGMGTYVGDYDYNNPSKEIKTKKGEEYIVNKIPVRRQEFLWVFVHDKERVAILTRDKKDIKNLPFRVKLMGLF